MLDKKQRRDLHPAARAPHTRRVGGR